MTKVRGISTVKSVFLSLDIDGHIGGPEPATRKVSLAWLPADEIWSAHKQDPPAIRCRYLVVPAHANDDGPGQYETSDDFRFGVSELLAPGGVSARVGETLSSLRAYNGRVFLVGHRLVRKVRLLRSAGVDLYQILPGVVVFDLSRAFQAMMDEVCLPSLTRVLKCYGLNNDEAYHVGNNKNLHYVIVTTRPRETLAPRGHIKTSGEFPRPRAYHLHPSEPLMYSTYLKYI